MPVVTVEMFEGRTPEQKQQIVEGITETFTKMGVPKDQIWIILHDDPRINWGMAGKLCD